MLSRQTRQVEQRVLMLSQLCRRWTSFKSTLSQHTTRTILYRICWPHAASSTLIDPPTVPDHVTSYDHWACAQTSHGLPCGNAVDQCNAVRSNLYRWTSQHDVNVVREHQGIIKNVTGFLKASRHLLKRQGKKLKRHGAVTLGRFGGNPVFLMKNPRSNINTCYCD